MLLISQGMDDPMLHYSENKSTVKQGNIRLKDCIRGCEQNLDC
jgi:hypothetical protein